MNKEDFDLEDFKKKKKLIDSLCFNSGIVYIGIMLKKSKQNLQETLTSSGIKGEYIYIYYIKKILNPKL